jgi:polyisoprenoid-binding protein YceI
MRSLLLLPLLLLPVLVLQDPHPPIAEQIDPVLEAGGHCVAYRAPKRAFFRETLVVGRSCDVEARIEWETEGTMAVLVVEVPAASFRSGSGRRDRDVARLLGHPQHPLLRFRSDPVAVEWLRRRSTPGDGRLAGMLEIAGEAHPVVFELATTRENDHLRIDAYLPTRFDELDLRVPRVGPGGIIADPGETLELFARLRLDRVGGAAQIAQR